jgi:Spy/CpxP family protein refolding chaperone
MSKIRSRMVGLLVLAGAAGVAGAQAPQQGQSPGARKEMHRDREQQLGQRALRGLLRGITLNDAEKARLQALGQKYRAQFEALWKSARPDFEAARAARQRGDTAAARAAFAGTADERQKLAALTEQVRVEARAALDPGHRAQFDANVARMKERLANRVQRWEEGRGGHRGGGKRDGRA